MILKNNITKYIKNIQENINVENNINLIKKELIETPLYLEDIIDDYSENFTIQDIISLLQNYKPKILNPKKDKKELETIFNKILEMEFKQNEHLLIYCEIIESSFNLDFQFFDFLLSFDEEKYELSFELFHSLWKEQDFLRVNEYPDINPEHKEKVVDAIDAIYNFPLGGRYIKKHYDHLYSLFTHIHPDLFDLISVKENPEYIYCSVYNYEPLILDPINDKDKLKDLYNDLIEYNEKQHSQSEMIEYLDISFKPFNSDYIFYPEEFEEDREEPFTFEEFYQLWLDKKLK